MTFSNSSEYDYFVHNVCSKCQHFKVDPVTNTEGCPITDMQICSDRDVQEQITNIFFIKKGCHITGCKCFRKLQEHHDSKD